MGSAGTRKKETVAEKRQRLITEAHDLEQEFGFIEDQLVKIVGEIKKLKPTKKELEDGVENLINAYYWGDE